MNLLPWIGMAITGLAGVAILLSGKPREEDIKQHGYWREPE